MNVSHRRIVRATNARPITGDPVSYPPRSRFSGGVREPAADAERGGVWLLADVLPELLAHYEACDDGQAEGELGECSQAGWFDSGVAGEPVGCATR